MFKYIVIGNKNGEGCLLVNMLNIGCIIDDVMFKVKVI